MLDNTPMRTASISHVFYLILITFIAFHCIYSEDVAGQESEVRLNNYDLFYSINAENQMTIFPEGINGNTVIPRNFNPLETTERIVLLAPMHVDENPLIIDGTVTANIYATGINLQFETEFIVTIHGEDPDMYEDVEFRSGPIQLTTSPKLITFTSPAINWIIEPEGLFTIRVNCTHIGGEAYLNHGNYEAGTYFSIRGNFISLSNVSLDSSEYGTAILSDPFQLVQENDIVSIVFLLYPDHSINYRALVIIEDDTNPGYQLILFPLPNETYHGLFESCLLIEDDTTIKFLGPYELLEIDMDEGKESSSISVNSVFILLIILILLIGLVVGYFKKDKLCSYYHEKIKKDT